MPPHEFLHIRLITGFSQALLEPSAKRGCWARARKITVEA